MFVLNIFYHNWVSVVQPYNYYPLLWVFYVWKWTCILLFKKILFSDENPPPSTSGTFIPVLEMELIVENKIELIYLLIGKGGSFKQAIAKSWLG